MFGKWENAQICAKFQTHSNVLNVIDIKIALSRHIINNLTYLSFLKCIMDKIHIGKKYAHQNSRAIIPPKLSEPSDIDTLRNCPKITFNITCLFLR